MILVGEPLPELRTICVNLSTPAGAPVPPDHAWIDGEVKVRRPGAPGGAFVDAVNRPAPVLGGADGSFDLELDVTEVAEVGRVRVQFIVAGVLLAEQVEEVRDHVLDLVLEPLANPGEGRTARECLTLATAFAAGDARGLDGPVGSIDSLASDPALRVKRIEFQIQSGRRTVTQRRGS